MDVVAAKEAWLASTAAAVAVGAVAEQRLGAAAAAVEATQREAAAEDGCCTTLAARRALTRPAEWVRWNARWTRARALRAPSARLRRCLGASQVRRRIAAQPVRFLCDRPILPTAHQNQFENSNNNNKKKWTNERGEKETERNEKTLRRERERYFLDDMLLCFAKLFVNIAEDVLAFLRKRWDVFNNIDRVRRDGRKLLLVRFLKGNVFERRLFYHCPKQHEKQILFLLFVLKLYINFANK